MTTLRNPPVATDDSPVELPVDAVESTRMSFGSHLEELRSCVIRALLGVVLAGIVCMYFGQRILAFLCEPLWAVQYANGLTPHLQVLSPTGAFSAYLKIGALSALIVAMPWVIYQLWRFVAAGLYTHEQRFMRLFVPVSIGLFALGVLFLYYVVLPLVLQFFISFNRSFETQAFAPTGLHRLLLPSTDAVPESATDAAPFRLPLLTEDPPNPGDYQAWVNATTRRLVYKTPSGYWSMPFDVGPIRSPMQSEFAVDFYVSFVLLLALGFGLAFETPIVVIFLAWSRIVSTAAMRRARRYVLLGCVVVGAVLTPPDVISQILMAGPMYLLFEAGLFVARMTERRHIAPAGG